MQVRMPGDPDPQGRVPVWECLRLRRRLHLPGLLGLAWHLLGVDSPRQ
jgi:hypothetical protein